MGLIYSSLISNFSEDILNLGSVPDGTSASPEYSRKSNLKRQTPYGEKDFPKTERKKPVTFDTVTVYYFPRAQGFTCVPSEGGSTLGMASKHAHTQHFSILEHAVERRRLQRQALLPLCSERRNTQVSPVESSYAFMGEEKASNVPEQQLYLDSHSSLQPVPPRQRRALLRAAGITKIDSLEEHECMEIRSSRKFCGCRCKGYCDPDKCSCSQAAIECQVEYFNFPCGCSRNGCANPSGRIELSSVQVRERIIHTLIRLDLENKQKTEEEKEEGGQNRSPMCSSSS
jgi:cysteine/serine-rich nuclear protein